MRAERAWGAPSSPSCAWGSLSLMLLPRVLREAASKGAAGVPASLAKAQQGRGRGRVAKAPLAAPRAPRSDAEEPGAPRGRGCWVGVPQTSPCAGRCCSGRSEMRSKVRSLEPANGGSSAEESGSGHTLRWGQGCQARGGISEQRLLPYNFSVRLEVHRQRWKSLG